MRASAEASGEGMDATAADELQWLRPRDVRSDSAGRRILPAEGGWMRSATTIEDEQEAKDSQTEVTSDTIFNALGKTQAVPIHERAVEL